MKAQENYYDWAFGAENFLVLEAMLDCTKQDPEVDDVEAADDAKTKA